MGDLAILVDDLGKQYRIGAPVVRYQTLRDTLGERFAAPWATASIQLRQQIWRCGNVSFEVRSGQVLADWP